MSTTDQLMDDFEAVTRELDELEAEAARMARHPALRRHQASVRRVIAKHRARLTGRGDELRGALETRLASDGAETRLATGARADRFADPVERRAVLARHGLDTAAAPDWGTPAAGWMARSPRPPERREPTTTTDRWGAPPRGWMAR